MTTSKGTRTEAQTKRDASAFFAFVCTLLGSVTLIAPAIVVARFVLEGSLPTEWPLGVTAGAIGLAILIWAAVERRAVKRATP